MQLHFYQTRQGRIWSRSRSYNSSSSPSPSSSSSSSSSPAFIIIICDSNYESKKIPIYLPRLMLAMSSLSFLTTPHVSHVIIDFRDQTQSHSILQDLACLLYFSNGHI
jgi:hypothetical protein